MLIGLFGLPFAVFGVFALSQAIKLMGAPAGSPSFWYPLMFGVIFSLHRFRADLPGIDVAASVMRGQLRLQDEHPNEPWLWRADWATGRVKSRTETNMIAAWVFAVIWNLISWPIAILAVPAAVQQKSPGAYFVLLFPAIGVFVLIYAIRQTIAFFEFGKTYFEMASVPGWSGAN